MKKYYPFILSLLMLCSVSFVSCSDKDEPKEEQTSIKLTDLPMAAQQFINKYFRNQTIYRIDKDDLTYMIIYSVYFEDCEVTFNEDGEWQQVAGHYGVSIPFEILPEPIQATLNERYPGFGVNQVTRQGSEFVVVLTDNQGGDGLRLIFNQSGEIINQSLPNQMG